MASQHRSKSVSVKSFERRLLHVERDRDVVLGRCLQDRPQRFRQRTERALEIDGVGPAQRELILIDTLVRGIGPR